jgi:hypothetical protein
MSRLRITYSLIYNIHAPKNQKKTAKQLIPLPGDGPKNAAEKRIQELQEMAALTEFAKAR